MKMKYVIVFLCSITIVSACSNNSDEKQIDQNSLGFIDADVNSNETNFEQKAEYGSEQPGTSEKFNRSFENAPPLIPHTTDGFFPIKKDNNICLNCHMPQAAITVGAVPLSRTHFSNLRPKPMLVEGKYTLPKTDSIVHEELSYLNKQYFNCSQCHVPQAKVTSNIENLFTPEFREEYGISKSNLRDKIKEGVK